MLKKKANKKEVNDSRESKKMCKIALNKMYMIIIIKNVNIDLIKILSSSERWVEDCLEDQIKER